MSEYKNELITVISSVFEDFAFMFTDLPELEPLPKFDNNYIKSEIEFKSETEKGKILIFAPYSLCIEVAINVLGLDEQVEPEFIRDSLKELANIICGKLVVELFGNKKIFNLSLPTLNKIDQAEFDNVQSSSKTVSVLVDDLPFMAQVEISFI